MLLFSREGGAYLIDRKFLFYRIKHPFYAKYLGRNGNTTLLDGELILNGHSLLYLAFDCGKHRPSIPSLLFLYLKTKKTVAIGISGQVGRNSGSFRSKNSVSSKYSSERFNCIRTFMDFYRKQLLTFCKGEKEPPIILQMKRHKLAKTYIRELFSYITEEENSEGEMEYFYTEKERKKEEKEIIIRRKTGNDGIILTPEKNNYLMDMGAPGSLLKWKPLQMNTIDFKVISPYFSPGKGEVVLYSNGAPSIGGRRRQGTVDIEFATMPMTFENRKKFNRLFEEMKLLNGGYVGSFIMECMYCLKEKYFKPVCLRSDKNAANWITTATATVRMMEDDVKSEEVIQSCESFVDRSHERLEYM